MSKYLDAKVLGWTTESCRVAEPVLNVDFVTYSLDAERARPFFLCSGRQNAHTCDCMRTHNAHTHARTYAHDSIEMRRLKNVARSIAAFEWLWPRAGYFNYHVDCAHSLRPRLDALSCLKRPLARRGWRLLRSLFDLCNGCN